MVLRFTTCVSFSLSTVNSRSDCIECRGPTVNRKHLKTLNPATGVLDRPQNIKEYEEWVRTNGEDANGVKDEDEEGSVMGGGGGGSEDGDE